MAYPFILRMVSPMIKRMLILFGLLLWSLPAHAIGLGQPLLQSHLGEPLDVHVPILLASGENLSQFSVSLATPQEYKQLEQALPAVYAHLRVDVDKQKPEVWIHTPYAVDDAIIDLVIKVKKGRGAFYKSMRLLLDAKDIQPTHTPSWVNQAKHQVYHASAQAKVAKPVAIEPADATYDGGWARRNRYGPVRSGDSLSEIAYRLRKDKRYSNRQVMLALFDANPDAFVNHNINRLKQGSFLRVPSDAAMQSFISSPRYQTLKSQLRTKHVRKQQMHKSKKMVEQQPQSNQKHTQAQQFRGRVSLGLTESLAQADINQQVLSRLDALEPMYQKAMASNLRIDGLDDKVDKLAKDVRSLHQKIDALAKQQAGMVKQDTTYGWWWFFGLVLLNIILLAAYLYHKQMKAWQNKLVEARQSMPETHHADTSSTSLPHPMHDDTPPFAQEWQLEQAAQVDEQGLAELVRQENDATHMAAQSEATIEDESSRHDKKAGRYQDADDTINLFEEMVHKKDWAMAERHYERLSEKEKERPRIQALWVQTLHGAGRVIERNITLLNLFKIYEYDQWHRFCSYFDQDVWRELQDEKIISYTGNVVETEIDKENLQKTQEKLEYDINDEIKVEEKDGSALDDSYLVNDTLPTDMLVGRQSVEFLNNPMQESVAQSIKNSELRDMGRVETDQEESLQDIISKDPELELEYDKVAGQEYNVDTSLGVDNGYDDTVLVTPDMLTAGEHSRLDNENQVDTQDQASADTKPPNFFEDKGDTVLVSPKKMKVFRQQLELDDD